MPSDAATPLPRLRQNLRLLPASPDEEGEPRWQLFDALSNKFYFLSRTALYLFREWRHAEDQVALLGRVAERGLEVSQQELDYFIRFLQQNHLLEVSDCKSVAEFSAQQAQRKTHVLMWLLHNYLFIKIPLLRPDLVLTRLYQRCYKVLNFPMPWLAGGIGALGLVMVLRQWETFTHTLQNFFSLSAIVYYAAALVLVKTAHELGHALVAKRYGCRVSSMGVAFLLMTPILYTDTTDAWRLRSRYQRLDIVTAGVRVEIYIACFATFLWAIVPSGSLRDVMFFVATTSWISSLLINISPFMRFDGYYALSDFLGMENLQPRSFLVGKWFLREKLFGFGFAPPEPLNRKKCLLMVSYAWGTWVYRFFLFIGIAVLVYYFAFKLLGIVLFLVEILWFLVFPIIKEIGVWLTLRKFMTINKASIVTLSAVLLMFAALLVPWQNQISAPAVITFERHQTFYPSEPSRVVTWQVAVDKKVKQGELLMLLESAEVEQEIRLTQVKLEALQTQWQRASSGASSSSTKLTLQTQISREQSQLQSLLERRERLVFQAPFDGYIGETLSLKKDDYVNEKMPLATLYDVQSGIVKAYISGRSVSRLKIGSEARFIGNDGTKLDTKLVVNNVLPTAITHLNYPGLSSVYDGPIAAQKMQDQIIPDTSIYEVLLSFKDTSSISRQVYGRVDLSVEPTSFLVEGGRYLYGVFIRESGF
ncbi:site-2 protease family protein [Marinomonas sp. FW-1]|uniref:site-2 protease family protein n=1 Tax=Marinomonas sp. FW-1 TaxID=2071621 RepID=UPI0010C0D29A|nr:site-2 protease family protein [Marinomonas sp. FW-1]